MLRDLLRYGTKSNSGKDKRLSISSTLLRFQTHPHPQEAIAAYLTPLLKKAKHRGYNFDSRKFLKSQIRKKTIETEVQLLYGWRHLKRIIRKRD